MLTQADNILRELSVSQLGMAAGGNPGSIGPDLQDDQYAEISATADRWLESLANAGVGLDAASLSVPPVAGAGAPAEEPATEEAPAEGASPAENPPAAE